LEDPLVAQTTYSINITPTGSDAWTIAILETPTQASGGTAITSGGTTSGDLKVAMVKAVNALFNDIVANGA
jgi:hypothetical protein